MKSQLALIEQPFSNGPEKFLAMQLSPLCAEKGESLLKDPDFQTLESTAQSGSLGPHSYLLFAGKLQALTTSPLELGSQLCAEFDGSPEPLHALALVVRQFPGQRNGMHVSALRFIGLDEKACPCAAE